jgi:hypothetical protein
MRTSVTIRIAHLGKLVPDLAEEYWSPKHELNPRGSVPGRLGKVDALVKHGEIVPLTTDHETPFDFLNIIHTYSVKTLESHASKSETGLQDRSNSSRRNPLFQNWIRAIYVNKII